MSEWPMVKLGEVCSISIGKTPARKELRYWGEGLPWLSIKDMNQGSLILKTTESISQIALDELKITPYSVGTVLFSFKLSIGKVGITAVPLFTNEAIAAIEPKAQESLNKYYLMEVLREVGKTVEGNAAVMGVTLNKKSLATLTIPLPPLGEQKRIAEILGEVSKAVELVSRQLEILDHGLKTKMWNDADESSHVSLDHYIQKITSGKSLKEGDSEDYQNSVLKISAVTTGYFNEMEVKPLPKSYDPPESHRANNGDILLSRANTTELVGASALVETSATNLFLPDKLWKLQLKDQVNAYFFWHLLQTKLVRSSISKASSGSGGSMKNISQKAFLAISVPEFSNEVQNQIGNIVREQRALRHLLRRKLSLLQELQKSLATRAFAGLL